MRIAISCHPTHGGSGIVATELAMALARRGHQIHVVSEQRPFRLAEMKNIAFHQVNVTDYPLFKHPPSGLCLANELAEVVAAHDIDILHAHYAIPHAISAMLAREMLCERDHHVRVVATLHGTDITLVGSDRSFYRVCRYAMLRCHGLTTVSQWLADQTQEVFKLDRPIEIIPNFVDCDRFTTKGRAAYPEDGAFRILHASNFRPVKRVFDVVRVFAQLRKALPKAQLVMVGDGPERGAACELAAELGVRDAVEFAGPQLNIEDTYRNCHLYLLLSDYESFGLSALEAMASGMPVVVSQAGGLVEVVEEGQSGFLRPVGDVAAMAAAAVSALDDKATWQHMSKAAAQHAREMFCKDKIIPQYELYYEKVIAAPPQVL
jgi:N-acetyl-alpha-D-glucosaminyl L-malate synthase BshA